MESNRLDDTIKKALENFQAEGQSHWESMEDMLNDPSNADLNERADDQILRNKLNSIEHQPPIGHWALMEAQLAGMEGEGTEELEDVMLDGKAYESLNELSTPYNEEHWPIMEEKIVAAFSWRKRAVRFKVAELALLFLAFVTVLQVWPEAKELLPKIKKNLPKVIAPAQAYAQTENSTDVNASTQQANDFTANLTDQDLTSSSSEANHLIAESNSIFVDREAPSNSNRRKAPAIPTTKSAKESNTLFSDINLLPQDRQQKLEAVPTLPIINNGLLPVDNLPFTKRKLNLAKLFSNSSVRIGMHGLSSIDALNTQGAEFNTTTPTVGYGSGIAVAFKTGRWEVESGIGYLSKSVRPRTQSINVDQVSLNRREIAGSSWAETKYDMIHIPAHVRFDFLDRSKWKMYAIAGLSMNINQNVIYRYEQVYLGPGLEEEFSVFPSGEDQEDRAKAFYPSAVSKNVGLSEDNINQNNVFFNFDAGLGLERSISQRYSAFLQSSYYHRLGEEGVIGLERESSLFRSAQVKLGVKVSIFKKK